jgi:hypothetical protein
VLHPLTLERLEDALEPRGCPVCFASHFLTRLQGLGEELTAFLDASADARIAAERSTAAAWVRAAERFAGRLGLSR